MVWANDLGAESDRKLIRYYANRRVWLFEPDRKHLLQLYQPR